MWGVSLTSKIGQSRSYLWGVSLVTPYSAWILIKYYKWQYLVVGHCMGVELVIFVSKFSDQLYTRIRVMHTGLLHTGTCTLGPRCLPRHLLTMKGIAFLPSLGGNVAYWCIKKLHIKLDFLSCINCIFLFYICAIMLKSTLKLWHPERVKYNQYTHYISNIWFLQK